MNKRDPKLTVLLFNECINNQDLNSLAALMSEEHTFIDREDTTVKSKSEMVNGWKTFFKEFPDYRNTFNKLHSFDNVVIIEGFAYWSKDEPYDPVIWKGTIENDLITEWRIYHENDENRKLLGIR
jgi:hypothetical protein